MLCKVSFVFQIIQAQVIDNGQINYGIEVYPNPHRLFQEWTNLEENSIVQSWIIVECDRLCTIAMYVTFLTHQHLFPQLFFWVQIAPPVTDDRSISLRA